MHFDFSKVIQTNSYSKLNTQIILNWYITKRVYIMSKHKK